MNFADTKKFPVVSVVMSVRNGMPYLHDAMTSILSQSLRNFEIIILDNASTDASVECIKSFNDSRIHLIKNEKDIGLSASLNRGFSLAKGKYIARMDADDISLPQRLELQVAFLEAHPDIGLCGGAYEVFGIWNGVCHPPLHASDILANVFFQTPFAHLAVMYRKEMWDRNHLKYDESLVLTQDYKMWCEVCFFFKEKTANLSEVILKYRLHENNETQSKVDRLNHEMSSCYKEILTSLCRKAGMSSSDADNYVSENILWHEMLSQRKKIGSLRELKMSGYWMEKLQNIYMASGCQCPNLFQKALYQRWIACCKSLFPKKIGAIFIFYFFVRKIHVHGIIIETTKIFLSDFFQAIIGKLKKSLRR